MQCPACSTDNPAGGAFCQKCGAALGAPAPAAGYAPAGGYTQVPQSGSTMPGQAMPAGGGTYTPAAAGLSDNAAGAIAYITFIPAIIFLVMEPYNRNPFVRFHAFQCIGLNVAWFVLGILFGIVGAVAAVIHLGILMVLLWPILWLGMFILWILCIVNASRGNLFKLPVIGNFAEQQSRR